MSELTVKFTGRLMTIGSVEPEDMPSGDVAVFTADVENLRALAPTFNTATTFHAGPVADAAPSLLKALKLACARLARVDGGDSMTVITGLDAIAEADATFDVETFIAAEDAAAGVETSTQHVCHCGNRQTDPLDAHGRCDACAGAEDTVSVDSMVLERTRKLLAIIRAECDFADPELKAECDAVATLLERA